MASPPSGSDEAKTASCAIPLTKTPKGWIAFSAVLQAKLGAPLRTTLRAAIDSADSEGKIRAQDERHSALFEHISDAIILALQNDHTLLALHGPLAPHMLHFPTCQ